MSSGFGQHFEKEMSSHTSKMNESHLNYMRTAAISGSSVATAIMFLISQMEKTIPTSVALYAAVVAIPCWFAAWQYIEAYMFYGERSLGHFNTISGSLVAIAFATVGAVSLFVSVTALIWQLSCVAAVLFILLSAVVFFAVSKHMKSVEKYIKENSA